MDRSSWKNNQRNQEEMNDEFVDFMVKVEQVGKVINGLTSKEEKEQEEAIKKADLLLHGKLGEVDEDACLVTLDKTIINDAPWSEDTPQGPERMGKEEFMAAMEKDCRERAKERRENKKISDQHNEEGMKAFREQKYEKALLCFNSAINVSKDRCTLYTNRALTYLKLGLPSKALVDAELVLRLDEGNIKAILYKSQALYMMGEVEKSDETIEEACKAHKKHADLFQENRKKWGNDESLTSGGERP